MTVLTTLAVNIDKKQNIYIYIYCFLSLWTAKVVKNSQSFS